MKEREIGRETRESAHGFFCSFSFAKSEEVEAEFFSPSFSLLPSPAPLLSSFEREEGREKRERRRQKKKNAYCDTKTPLSLLFLSARPGRGLQQLFARVSNAKARKESRGSRHRNDRGRKKQKSTARNDAVFFFSRQKNSSSNTTHPLPRTRRSLLLHHQPRQ